MNTIADEIDSINPIKVVRGSKKLRTPVVKGRVITNDNHKLALMDLFQVANKKMVSKQVKKKERTDREEDELKKIILARRTKIRQERLTIRVL